MNGVIMHCFKKASDVPVILNVTYSLRDWGQRDWKS